MRRFLRKTGLFSFFLDMPQLTVLRQVYINSRLEYIGVQRWGSGDGLKIPSPAAVMHAQISRVLPDDVGSLEERRAFYVPQQILDS